MPLDGLSFSNSNYFRIATPGEIANQAEHLAQVQAETNIKKPEEKEGVKPDLEENYEDQEQDLQGRDSDEESDGSVFEDEEKIKKYKVKFNQISDMVELVDRKTGLVIETISPSDLLSLISKSKGASGILVDKEI